MAGLGLFAAHETGFSHVCICFYPLLLLSRWEKNKKIKKTSSSRGEEKEEEKRTFPKTDGQANRVRLCRL
jgi:hypothetical protein